MANKCRCGFLDMIYLDSKLNSLFSLKSYVSIIQVEHMFVKAFYPFLLTRLKDLQYLLPTASSNCIATKKTPQSIHTPRRISPISLFQI